jgi:major membrane immunogen (membrane-anchored lipoprotein)
MGGLARICKMYGSMEVSDANGKKITWLWDYKNDKPRLKSEMTKEEIAESEKAKWQQIRSQMDGS